MRCLAVVATVLSLPHLAAAGGEKIAICHRTGSSSTPLVKIQVSESALPAHLDRHGDFTWDPTLHDDQCRLMMPTACGDTSASAARSCRAILEECGPHADGVYWIDPSGGLSPAFEVYCDMTRNGGGWALVGKLGEAAPPSSDFSSDLDVAVLLDAAPPMPSQYAHLDLRRFDGWGSEWTVRTETDAWNDQSHFQLAFFRPATGATLLPGEAGVDWSIADPSPWLVHLTMSTTTGLANATWLPVPACDGGHCTAPPVLWTYRDPAGGGDCLDAAGETRYCHSVQGAISPLHGGGTMTAATGMQDGVPHGWGRKGTYWIKDASPDGTP